MFKSYNRQTIDWRKNISRSTKHWKILSTNSIESPLRIEQQLEFFHRATTQKPQKSQRIKQEDGHLNIQYSTSTTPTETPSTRTVFNSCYLLPFDSLIRHALHFHPSQLLAHFPHDRQRKCRQKQMENSNFRSRNRLRFFRPHAHVRRWQNRWQK